MTQVVALLAPSDDLVRAFRDAGPLLYNSLIDDWEDDEELILELLEKGIDKVRNVRGKYLNHCRLMHDGCAKLSRFFLKREQLIFRCIASRMKDYSTRDQPESSCGEVDEDTRHM